MAELKRWRAHLGIPINLEPKYFRVPTEMAARLIIAADLKDLNALALTGFLGRAVWEEERDISDAATLKATLARILGTTVKGVAFTHHRSAASQRDRRAAIMQRHWRNTRRAWRSRGNCVTGSTCLRT